MSENPLHVLQKGLAKLKDAGNIVDEEAVLDLLENEFDYEHGFTQLTSQQQIWGHHFWNPYSMKTHDFECPPKGMG